MSAGNEFKEHRLCPFMRVFVRIHDKREELDALQRDTYKAESLAKCSGEGCMAYKNGHCLRLEKSEYL